MTRPLTAMSSAQQPLRLGCSKVVIVGMGLTGLSCARFLQAQGVEFVAVDSRSEPPKFLEFQQAFPDAKLYTGAFDRTALAHADCLVVSPGVSLAEPVVRAACDRGAEIIGDIELFARHVRYPFAAITGSNGKSTVTTLVGEMAKQSGYHVGVGGNLGTPALDLLQDPEHDLFVLELSSFQLETTRSLRAQVATVLNISADHLDRHKSMAAYAAAKQQIFNGAGSMVLNADDSAVMAMAQPGRAAYTFTLSEPHGPEAFGVLEVHGKAYLARGRETLLQIADLRMGGWHNVANALAALALGTALEFELEAMLATLRVFAGLPHRCQWVARGAGVDWYDDSKGTNVGATCAALQGLGRDRPLVLIAGGDGKGQDFSPLIEAGRERLRASVVIGRDGPLVAQALRSVCPVAFADTMETAVSEAGKLARPGDAVLLSPACSSLDMFSSYIERSRAFVAAVAQWVQQR